jgi:hypothetical protein
MAMTQTNPVIFVNASQVLAVTDVNKQLKQQQQQQQQQQPPHLKNLFYIIRMN